MKYWVIIPAAGSGTRFNQTIPKQYLKIHGKSLLTYTIENFLANPLIHKIFLPLSHDSLFDTLSVADHPKIQKIAGGETRMLSVKNALDALKEFAAATDWVLVHDAVRPCLHPDDLTTLIDTLKDDEVGGILGNPICDTVKSVSGGTITRTIDRTLLWHATTPQMFRYGILMDAINYCLSSETQVTDEASAIEQLGYNPKMVTAAHPNPKLTHERDQSYIAMLLTEKNEASEMAL